MFYKLFSLIEEPKNNTDIEFAYFNVNNHFLILIWDV